MRTTSIVIVSADGLARLKETIHSIRLFTGTPVELIVVDNGSQDGSIAYCRREGVVLVSNGSDPGFAAACNMGMKLATGEQLLLLSNDVIVARNWLANMSHCLHSRPDIGIAGPLTNGVAGNQHVPFVYPSLAAAGTRLNVPDSGKWRQADRVSGFCLLMKRQLLERVGYMEETLPPGKRADDDYCDRARMAGYRVMIAGDTFVYRLGGDGRPGYGDRRPGSGPNSQAIV